MTVATQAGAFPADADLPMVSVVIACRNESSHIGACLDSLLVGTYPSDRLELLVADGRSDDGTREIIRDYEGRHPQVRLVDNPLLTATGAFNAGIRAARGDAIAIVGAHAVYGPEYLYEVVRHLIAFDADQAGGVASYRPRTDSIIGHSLATAQAVPFGAGMRVGYKVGTREPRWVDTVFCGVFRKRVFTRLGLFDERLTFTADLVFNDRLRRSGGRILLVPSAGVTYLSRSEPGSYLRHQFRNGAWNLIPLAHTDAFFLSLRHLIPMVFVAALAAFGVLALLVPWGRYPLMMVAGSYLAAALVASLHAAIKHGRPGFALTLPVVFALTHITYGVGSWWGAVELMRRKAAQRRG